VSVARRLRATRALASPSLREGASARKRAQKASAEASSQYVGRITSRGLSAPWHRRLHRPEVVLVGLLAVERIIALLLTLVEHEEGEREQVGLARELKAAREEDCPRAEAVPGLREERGPREAAEGQLGEARVG
jgi:hypothetical protein